MTEQQQPTPQDETTTTEVNNNNNISKEEMREVHHLKVDTRFAMIRVEPKVGEGSDANFPRNLHNAAELFLRVNMVEAADRLQQCTSSMLDIYATNPDGSTGVSIGRACVCWNCGHVGLPQQHYEKEDTPEEQEPTDTATGKSTNKTPNKKSSKSKKAKKKKDEYGVCRKCKEDDQTNWVRVVRQLEVNSGSTPSDLPWIEKTPLTPEQQAKKDAADKAAKRKEIEANVAAELAKRLAASTTVSSSAEEKENSGEC
mmetsp:Transcript_7803/g.11900  ORF Transcript_7803/g.11900 Transcript_7803/m.11900 type:complete len:256 (+) Transcript_7803:71-838(+)|eukprot:CAMPEP_0195301070 /NCGR_PEP_ID=MMETSP0707-20130614/28685_1 /TAXON_ID=33640 /ORGANISM="Asterionellopsis glacialis, Strain CCMP134" /LENGTH=255 /DNA_ID=CAMNT_0040363925 /DNA_START=67 /DNA_END=834 /DNA_ORIENTATION=-